jgi:N-acetyl-anhydromuramyl-L-alanine amidase AmpD
MLDLIGKALGEDPKDEPTEDVLIEPGREENDMDYPIIYKPSPNQSGGMDGPKGVVFHHTAGSVQGSVSWVTQARSQVSYHIIIDEDGTQYWHVPLDKKAWHAGKSAFKGRISCNSFMLGIAFGGSTYERSLKEAEIDSAISFLEDHWDHFGWTSDWMTDHRTVSPGRKNDLNPTEWKRLHERIVHYFG